jgi:hypothetical protein
VRSGQELFGLWQPLYEENHQLKLWPKNPTKVGSKPDYDIFGTGIDGEFQTESVLRYVEAWGVVMGTPVYACAWAAGNLDDGFPETTWHTVRVWHDGYRHYRWQVWRKPTYIRKGKPS